VPTIVIQTPANNSREFPKTIKLATPPRRDQQQLIKLRTTCTAGKFYHAADPERRILARKTQTSPVKKLHAFQVSSNLASEIGSSICYIKSF